jgi:hypothetical protein
MSDLTHDALRHLRHIATVTTPSSFWTLRLPAGELKPLVVAGYVVRNVVAKDMYRITVLGLTALLETESEGTR